MASHGHHQPAHLPAGSGPPTESTHSVANDSPETYGQWWAILECLSRPALFEAATTFCAGLISIARATSQMEAQTTRLRDTLMGDPRYASQLPDPTFAQLDLLCTRPVSAVPILHGVQSILNHTAEVLADEYATSLQSAFVLATERRRRDAEMDRARGNSTATALVRLATQARARAKARQRSRPPTAVKASAVATAATVLSPAHFGEYVGGPATWKPRYTHRLPRCGVRRRRRWADACHPWFAIFVEGSADNEKKDDGDVKRARD